MFDLVLLMCLASRLAKQQFPVSFVLLTWVLLVSVPFIIWFLLVAIVVYCVDQIGRGGRRLSELSAAAISRVRKGG